MSEAPPSARFDAWDALRVLRTAGPALAAQAGNYAELVGVEWTEERRRLLRLALATALGFAFLLCILLASGAVLLAATWDTGWRWPSAAALLIAYASGLAWSWQRAAATHAQGSASFSATREELAADLAILRSRA
jgi:uncharacterized membrane protein YqjE